MRQKRQNFFLYMKLKNKILSIILFCTALVLLFTVISTQYISNSYEKSLYQSISNSLSYSSNEILQKLETIHTLTYTITENAQIQSNLSELKDSKIIYSSDYNYLYSLLQSYYSGSKHNNVVNLSIFTEQYALHTNTSIVKQLPGEVYETVLAAAESANGRSIWVTEFCQDYGLFIAKKIRRMEALKLDNLGIEVFHIDINNLIQSCISLKRYENFIYLLTDEDGEIIYNPRTLSEEEVLRLQMDISDTYGITRLGKDKFFFTTNTIDQYRWKYFCFIPYNQVFESIMRALVISIFLILFCLMLVFFVSKRLVWRLTGRFNDLIKQMDYFAKSDPTQAEIVYDYPPGDDEISLLYKHFDHMTQEIGELIRTNYANRLLMKEAQIKALEMQINPHFLYNTLETINWRAKSAGEKDISKMVEALAQLLRMTLSSDFALIPLREELKLVQSYIVIQQIRFEERLDYQESISPSVTDALIPKLTLQPIIENAVRYAMEKITDVCHIQMTIEKVDEILHIYIKNNGSQYEDNLLEKLRMKQAKTSGHGIGLLNIDERIKLTFGEQYGITLYNENAMAVTFVTLPYQISSE